MKILTPWEKLMNRQAELQEKIEALDGWNLEHRLERAMMHFQCPDRPQPPVNILSEAKRRRVALCACFSLNLMSFFSMSPLTTLDAESVQWLETHLKQYKGTVICITHDRYFLTMLQDGFLNLTAAKDTVEGPTILHGLNRRQKD